MKKEKKNQPILEDTENFEGFMQINEEFKFLTNNKGTKNYAKKENKKIRKLDLLLSKLYLSL